MPHKVLKLAPGSAKLGKSGVNLFEVAVEQFPHVHARRLPLGVDGENLGYPALRKSAG